MFILHCELHPRRFVLCWEKAPQCIDSYNKIGKCADKFNELNLEFVEIILEQRYFETSFNILELELCHGPIPTCNSCVSNDDKSKYLSK
jgi:hypothetical protein